jgi:hypothetical protein
MCVGDLRQKTKQKAVGSSTYEKVFPANVGERRSACLKIGEICQRESDDGDADSLCSDVVWKNLWGGQR